MKLTGRDAIRYFARPDPDKTGVLIYGSDAMRVALRRQEIIRALIGPAGEEEMRLSRISAATLRKEPALLQDAIKAQGFFPGPRVVFLEDATDTIAKIIEAALHDWQTGDAKVIVTAGQLATRSGVRKLFEGQRNSYAIGLYDDPPSREEIEATIKAAGLQAPDSAAMTNLTALAQILDPGDFRQTVEKLALYMLDQYRPPDAADIAACAPLSTEASLDDILNIVAEAKSGQIGPVMTKLKAQGTQPVGLCIGATRHFRTLYAAAADPGGAAAGMARMRPPVFGPRRDRMIRQASAWGAPKLEVALTMLTDTDLQLRSAGQNAPAMELVERTLIRLAMLARH
jgi:DNA polymerase-3 subunit delta